MHVYACNKNVHPLTPPPPFAVLATAWRWPEQEETRECHQDRSISFPPPLTSGPFLASTVKTFLGTASPFGTLGIKQKINERTRKKEKNLKFASFIHHHNLMHSLSLPRHDGFVIASTRERGKLRDPPILGGCRWYGMV
jgi:hypothetical protein